jgi:hypothetical protein
MSDWKKSWPSWRDRAKAWKAGLGRFDEDLAAELTELRAEKGKNPVARGTLNSWINKRDLNLSDFMELCEIMDADPRYLLFNEPASTPVPNKPAPKKKKNRPAIAGVKTPAAKGR